MSELTNPDPQGTFHFDDARPSFEDMATDDGFRSWSARQYMELLGYESWDAFKPVLNKAIGATMTAEIDVASNFVQVRDLTAGRVREDYRLSKFACYMVAMNADSKRPAVARAQAYFATFTQAFQEYIHGAEDVERIEIRQEITEHESTLGGMARSHGVKNYAFFQNSGYMGLYNMSLRALKRYKRAPKEKRPLLDFMGKRELAANLFRITETEARIQSRELEGQSELEAAAFEVGRVVRRTMIETGGALPEDLPLAPDIKKVQTDLRRTYRALADSEKELPPRRRGLAPAQRPRDRRADDSTRDDA